MQSTATVEIERDIDAVFVYTTERVAEWSTIVVDDQVLSEGPVGVGTTFRTRTRDHGREMVFEGVVTQHDPPKAHAVKMTGKQFDLDVSYRFEQVGGGTRVMQDSLVRGKGLFKVILVLLGWAMRQSNCKAADQELANLKRLMEADVGDENATA